MVQPETLWKLVSKWVTPSQADIERAVIYTFHSVMAEGWRQGRLMLAGDAAHQTPPFLGQGMCAAIRDVSNLAWKLDAVLRGRADDALLDTYESERSPHVQAFIELAVKLGDIIQTTDPQAARERDAKFKAGQPEIFQFPMPRLGPGVWLGEQAPVAQVFPQPTLANGDLLDTLLGLNFAVLGEDTVLAEVSEDTRERWQAQGLVTVPARDPEVKAWLDQQGVRAVLLRPDRYILGVAQNSADLDRISALLPAAGALAHGS
jgi:3-(3-hydroxy-phenyl)propionate hydroxylase